MSATTDTQQQFIRQAFKTFNRFVILNWRLGLGPYWSLWPAGFGRYLVLVHTGRKSGLQRRTPVNFTRIDGDYYVTAGWGEQAQWYKNIIANPHIEIWTPDGWWQADAEVIDIDDAHIGIMRDVLKGSGFAAFAAGVNPYTLSDGELADATSDYRLLRLRPVAARSGPGGPSDLVWVWPLLMMALLVMRPRRSCHTRGDVPITPD